MTPNRFQNYDNEVRNLVLSFEEMQTHHTDQYFDVDQLEIISDFYLESQDTDMLESCVLYGEQLFPDNSSIRLRRAHLCSIRGQYERAMRILRDLERIEPDNTDVQYAMGTVYSMMDHPRKAIQCYQKAATDGYEVGMIYGNIADEYYKLNRIDDAIRYYKKSIADNPNEERSLYNLASTWDEMGQHQEAVQYFNQFVSEEPYSKVGWYCLGCIYMYSALWEHAIDAFEYALAIDKTFGNAYISLSECYRQMGDYGKAVAALRESVDYADDKAYVYYSIGLIYKSRKNYDTAVIYLRKATEIDHYYGDAWLEIARCYEALSLPSDAEQMYQYALRVDGDRDDFWLSYADFLMRYERYKEAADLLQRGAVDATSLFEFNVRLAVCYFRTGRRNFLFNAIRACMNDRDRIDLLFAMCPEMRDDLEIQNMVQCKE